MHNFMVLLFITAVTAAPQYNYQQNGGHATAANQIGIFPGQSSFVGQHGLANGQGSSLSIGSLGAGSVAAPSLAVQQQQHVAPQVVYNKQIFIHSAPQDDGLEGVGSANQNTVLKKNLRVVIVRAPENKGLTEAALQLAKSASEDKTVVYVLNKQTDLGELQNQLSQIQANNPNKPEVHFVKYNTQEEAEHAQHSIQSQYDSFGGPTQVLDEGVAPVESFIGSLGGGGGLIGGGSIGGGSIGAGSIGGGSIGSGSIGGGLVGASNGAGSGPGGVAAQGQNVPAVSNTYLPTFRLY